MTTTATTLKHWGGYLLPALFAALLLTCLSCSRHISPAATPGHTLRSTTARKEVTHHLSSADMKRFDHFAKEGIEKPLDTRRVTPDAVIASARRYLGTPHCMGGITAKCMDCSGLLFRAFADNGITIPRSSEEQARYGIIITDTRHLQPGDLLFFIKTYKTSRFITHSAIYTGNNTFIHASSSRGVTLTRIDDKWWQERYLYATRVFQ